MKKLREEIQKVAQALKPFKNIIWFLFLFISIDFIWKLIIDEGDGNMFIVFGKDYTYIIEPINIWTTKLTHWVVSDVFGYKDFIINGNLIYFDGALRFRVVWECTGIKQMIMFGLLITLYYGPWKKKLWYVPLSMFILILINLTRIIGVVFITKEGFPAWFIGFNEWYNNRVWDGTDSTYWLFYKDWFEFFHKDVFRWLYYNGIIFILWLIWEEKFNLPYQRIKKRLKANKSTENQPNLK